MKPALIFLVIASVQLSQAQLTPKCTPVVGPAQIVASAEQRFQAGTHAVPKITSPFDWPDTPLGVLKTSAGYLFFGSDGDTHANGNYGSVTRTIGTLSNPLGAASGKDSPADVVIQPNLAINPDYPNYDYIGGGPVYRVPSGQPGAGNLLLVYHAERSTTGLVGFYSLLGLAKSTDEGVTWTDLGEIIQLNQPYESNLDGFEIGDSHLVVDPTRTYFYVYFPDWIANGTVSPNGTSTVMSVARTPIAQLLSAASSTTPTPLPSFSKYYEGAWDQPGINGLSTDLRPDAGVGGSPSVVYNTYIGRYVVIADDTSNVSYSESPDGIDWSSPAILLASMRSALYATPIGTGENPDVLGADFYVFYSNIPEWTTATVERFSISCNSN